MDCKNDKRHKSSHHHPSSSRYGKRSKSSPEDDKRNSTAKKSREPDENFSFLDHKHFFNKVLNGFIKNEQLVDDVVDFWIFMNKYENVLRKTGQSVLASVSTDSPDNCIDTVFLGTYNKNFSVAITLKPSKAQLKNHCDSNGKINEQKLYAFYRIVTYYLDFKQKERFNKIKKLRKFQYDLPIHQYRNEIVNALKHEQILILAGNTGCGKSTQMPVYLKQAGYEQIICTQPRRIACISLAKRVSHEMLTEYNSSLTVGYQIRFERHKTLATKILFITEGLLLRQLADEDNLSKFSVIILDEIHERHLYGDFLIGLSKCLLQSRPDIKIVLMSATINLKLFSDFFSAENAKVIEIPGRLFPIKLHYMPQNFSHKGLGCGNTSKTERLNPEAYISIMQMIDKKYSSQEKGDLLIFQSGLNEITSIAEAANEYNEKNNNWIILPLHSSMAMSDQDKVFDYAPDGMRKVIISTNIAETSLTIDGIRFVIDSGKVKEMTYDPIYKMKRLKELWISQASAEQRKGRAGRTGPGVCYRLYSQKEFQETLEPYSKAEIHKVPLESLLLQMISMGLPNARLFPFIEPPTMDSIENAIVSLKQMGALTQTEKLTPLGKSLSKIPVEGQIGKMLIEGSIFKQLQPILTMAAALNVQSPFTNRAYRDQSCERLRKDLESNHGDPVTLINLYREWLLIKQTAADQTYGRRENSKKWCRDRGLEEQRFYEITKLKSQLESLLKECDLIKEEEEIKLTSTERSLRHGEKRYLKQLQRTHQSQAPRQRKLLKTDTWCIDEGDTEDLSGRIDIKDVEFRLTNDFSKIQNMVHGASADSFEDMTILKLILVSGLYPQIAIADEFNFCKSANEQFFHTKDKPYTSLHPMSYFGQNHQILHLNDADITEQTGVYKSKLKLSSKHQLLCYLNILETTKAYLMNTMRMPAAQTMLLFAQSIDTNLTFSRIICDAWICVDFPFVESGQTLLARAANLRDRWNTLLLQKLKNDDESETSKSESNLESLEYDLARFMNSEVFYTVKRLLPADLKLLYKVSEQNYEHLILNPNPFSDDFKCILNVSKGGVLLTPNITYGSLSETDWSLSMFEEIIGTDWTCEHCGVICNVNNIEKMQHLKACTPIKSKTPHPDPSNHDEVSKSLNNKKFDCQICMKAFHFNNLEILKHKKRCIIKEENE